MEGLTAFLARTENTVLAQTINRSPWLYPAIETAHILDFAVLIGSATMFDLRLLGASRALSVRGMARHLLPWARRGFVVAAGAGVLLLASDATRVGTSLVLYAKLGLIGLARLNMGVFHARVFRSVADWDQGVPPPTSARLAGAVSLLAWVMVVVLGRLIVYL